MHHADNRHGSAHYVYRDMLHFALGSCGTDDLECFIPTQASSTAFPEKAGLVTVAHSLATSSLD